MNRRPPHHRNTAKRHKKPAKNVQNKNNLPKNAAQIELTITHIGGRGDGIGKASYTHNYQTAEHSVFVPDALPDEVVIVQPLSLTGQGIQAELRELVTASPARKNPDCGASPACGGCQFQHMSPPAYQSWKSQNLLSIIEKAELNPVEWREDYFASPHARRRARLAFRRRKDDALIGFRERGSHQIIYPTDCSILKEEIKTLIAQMRDDLLLALDNGMTGEVDITLCDNGCDVSLQCDSNWPQKTLTDLTQKAAMLDIARLSLVEKNQPATLLFVKQAPALHWQLPQGASEPTATLHPAPSSFLQADGDAEMVMKTDIFNALAGAQNILDLFAGSGTLSAPLLFQSPPPQKIAAYDSVKDALSAYDQIAFKQGLSMHLETTARNLFDAPLTPKELEGFDAAIIDPPRAGAIAQMPALAQSAIPTLIMVSCNPHSFARDAGILTKGGYDCQWARHIDQFALSAHSEIIACFTKEIIEA